MTTNPPTDEQSAAARTKLQDQVYDALAKFNATAEWDVLKLAQMRQHLAEHLTDALLPELAADEQPAEAHPTEFTFRIEAYDGDIWLPVGYPRSTLDEAREVRDLRRVKNPGACYRIVEWTASARVIESDDVPADTAAVTA
ncbi:hypothetical protein ACFXKC_28445 [Streptomyces sp. NPDC059340]|uniref:hypothetical protein n=1 Tax=Streptomyces sp. NPDC059340 TaxID=3346806 RepID=UPI0036B03146